MPKKRHHFVPRFYLRAWAQKDKVYCLQNGEIRSPNIGNVAAENYFYRLEELSPGDVEFLREAIIRDSPERLKASHEQLLRAFAAPYQAKRQLEASDRLTAEANAEIDRLIVELNENFHTHIETDFQRHLASMISGSLDFLEEPGEAALFYRGLMVQYARTNHVKQTRRVMDPERLRLYLRVANPLAHMVALNVGLSLYAERKRHRIILLDNATDLPFITADQPVINIASNPKDTAPPAEFELYYPLSPTKAMLLVEPSGSFLPRDSSVPETFVRLYNLRIASHSYRQVFANSPDVLESVKSELPAYLSCFPEKPAYR
jgi:hypothetical protein